MITPTIVLDRSYRPIEVPDHYVAYKSTLSSDRLIATVSFLRIRDGDPDVRDYIKKQNEGCTPATCWKPCYAEPSTVWYMIRAAAGSNNIQEFSYERTTIKDSWSFNDQDDLNKLLRIFANPGASEAERQ